MVEADNEKWDPFEVNGYETKALLGSGIFGFTYEVSNPNVHFLFLNSH